MKEELRFKQIIPCQWKDTYSVVGLTIGGVVWVYEKAKNGWTRYSMHAVDNHEVNNH